MSALTVYDLGANTIEMCTQCTLPVNSVEISVPTEYIMHRGEVCVSTVYIAMHSAPLQEFPVYTVGERTFVKSTYSLHCTFLVHM